MPEKRLIDRKRDAGGAIDVGMPNDQSAVTAMIQIGEQFYVVKECGIYEIKLADQIDPQRTNIAIPDTQQKVLEYGSDSPFVGRTLLTAKELLNPSFLPNGVDLRKALRLNFEALKDLAAMLDVATALEEAQRTAIAAFEGASQKEGSVALPAVGNIDARCKDFVQKADHSLQSLMRIVRVFNGEDAGRQWFEGFSNLVSNRYGDGDQFSKFLVAALPFLKFVRNARNCVEHSKDNKKIVTRDFSVQADGAVLPPTIEVIHPDTPMSAVPVSEFMGRAHAQTVTMIEQMIVFICQKHVRPPLATFPVQVVEWPEGAGPQKHVRYSYGCYDPEGRVIRVS
jgi:hypothetical protein